VVTYVTSRKGPSVMAELRKDGDNVVMIFDVNDVYKNTAVFANHRDYIAHMFRLHGYEITKWNWDKNPENGKWEKYEDGLKFMSTDRQVDIAIEITGTVGKNIRRIENG